MSGRRIGAEVAAPRRSRSGNHRESNPARRLLRQSHPVEGIRVVYPAGLTSR